MSPPSRQVVYIGIDEDITSIFERVRGIRKKDIVLAVPRKAVLFQSAVNLKILKTKLADLHKNLIIVTSDRNGRHLAEGAGIEVWSRVEVEQANVPPEDSPQMRIQPIQALRNVDQREEQPKRFTEKKMSIRELIQQFRKQDGRRQEDGGTSGHPFHFERPSRKFLALIVVASLGLFMLISYIALPSATIYIRPTFDHLDHTVNITLADKRKNQTLLRKNEPHVIASETVSATTRQTKVFNTSGKVFNGTNATGRLTIINTTDEDWTLKGGTRFASDEGIVFRIPVGVVVSARTRDEAGEVSPGRLTASVVADPFDLYGRPVGDRGNLPPARFTIPSLSKYNQRLIWGESDEPMTGGVTDYQPVVTKEDIEAAKKQTQDNLILMAKEELRTYIDEMNKLNQTSLTLLDDSRYLKTELLDLKLPDDLEGSNREKFELFAKISAQGVAFDFDQLFVILKKELEKRTHPSMRLRENSISPENITYEVIDEDPLVGQLKITATIDGIEEFDIDSSTEAGARFGARIKEKILGLSAEEAKALIGNFEEVDAVEIKTWPLWIHNIPRIPESIDIKLMD